MSSRMEANKAKPGVRMILLRLLSSLAVNMYVYSGFAFIRTILFYDDGGFTSVMLYACSILPAYLAGSLLNNKTPLLRRKAGRDEGIQIHSICIGYQEDGPDNSHFDLLVYHRRACGGGHHVPLGIRSPEAPV